LYYLPTIFNYVNFIASNCRMTSNYILKKDVEGSGYDVFCCIILQFSRRKLPKIQPEFQVSRPRTGPTVSRLRRGSGFEYLPALFCPHSLCSFNPRQIRRLCLKMVHDDVLSRYSFVYRTPWNKGGTNQILRLNILFIWDLRTGFRLINAFSVRVSEWVSERESVCVCVCVELMDHSHEIP